MTQDEVEWRDCCSLHAVTSSVIYYSTHVTQENVIEGLSNGLLKGFWGMKKENMDLIPSVRVSFNNQ